MRLSRGEPPGAISLGERLLPSLLRGPFERERVAAQVRRVGVTFERPGVDPLATRLTQRGQRKKRPRGWKPRLFLKLAPRSSERVFPGLHHALRNRPGSLILHRPERPAGLH